jgi:hypothetical protein
LKNCKRVIQLQKGFDKSVTFNTDSSEPKRLEILRNGIIVKTYFAIESGDFLGSDFSSDFEIGEIELKIGGSDIQALLELDRFFDFRLIIGDKLTACGEVQVFEILPNCAKASSVIKSNIEISQSENTKPFNLDDIDVTPIVIETQKTDSFFDKIMNLHGYKP